MTRLLALACFLVLALSGRAQTGEANLLRSGDLLADAGLLRRACEALHPGLYRYNSKEEIDRAFEALNRQLDHDQPLRDAFLAFAEFAAKVRCGHTQANPFNQSPAVVESLFRGATRVPFYFAWLDRRMVVTRDFTPEHDLPVGSEIEQIDGVPAAEILARLLSVARADGANDCKRIAELGVRGDSEFEAFDLFYPLFFPLIGGVYTLQVRRPDSSRSHRLQERPLTFEQRFALIQDREHQRKGGDGSLFEWSELPDGSADLRMPTWALYNSKWDWKAWLNERLNAAAGRGLPALIIDLRGNEGGDDVGDEIIRHLIDTPITLTSMVRLVRYRKAPEELGPFLDTWDKSFRDWGASAVALVQPWPTAPAGVTYLKLTRNEDAQGEVIRPTGERVRSKVFVLVDASNSSATFQFAQNIQQYRLGTLVGAPTGGSQRGINGGAFFFLHLPHSGIEMDIPLVGTFPTVPASDAGVTPEILVSPTAADVAENRDVVMAAALRAIHLKDGSAD